MIETDVKALVRRVCVYVHDVDIEQIGPACYRVRVGFDPSWRLSIGEKARALVVIQSHVNAAIPIVYCAHVVEGEVHA